MRRPRNECYRALAFPCTQTRCIPSLPGCTLRGNSKTRATARRNDAARSGILHAGNTLAFQSTARIPAPARLPPPLKRRKANANIGRSKAFQGCRAGGDDRQSPIGLALPSAEDNLAGPHILYWWTCE